MSSPPFAARRLFARGSILLSGSGVALVASFLQTVLVARGLGPTSFGIWASIQAFCTVVATLVTFRTSEPVTRYLAEYRHTDNTENRMVALLLGTAIGIDVITQFLAILAIYLMAPWVAPSLPGGAEAIALYLLVGIGSLRSIFDATWFSVARHLGRYRSIALLNALFPILRLIATATCWSAHWMTLTTFVHLMMLMGILQMVVTGWYLWRAIRTGYNIPPAHLLTSDLWKCQHKLASFWDFMKATFLWSLFSAMVKEGDVLLLGSLRPAEEVGWYRLAKNLAGIVQQVGELLAQVIYQDFSEQVVGRQGILLRHTIRFLSRTWLPIVAVVSLMGILIAYYCIPLIFGATYQPTVYIFSILMIGVGWVTGLFWVRPLMLALELYWYNFQVVAWGAGLFLLVDWALIHLWQVEGAALAFSMLTAAGPLVLLPLVWGRLKQMCVAATTEQ